MSLMGSASVSASNGFCINSTTCSNCFTESSRVSLTYAETKTILCLRTKAIVIAHNGQIRAFNNDRGGATFIIVYPIYRNSKS